MLWIIFTCISFMITMLLFIKLYSIYHNDKLVNLSRRRWRKRYINIKTWATIMALFTTVLVLLCVYVYIDYTNCLADINAYNNEVEMTRQEKEYYNDWITSVHRYIDYNWSFSNLYNTLNPGYCENLDYIR